MLDLCSIQVSPWKIVWSWKNLYLLYECLPWDPSSIFLPAYVWKEIKLRLWVSGHIISENASAWKCCMFAALISMCCIKCVCSLDPVSQSTHLTQVLLPQKVTFNFHWRIWGIQRCNMQVQFRAGHREAWLTMNTGTAHFSAPQFSVLAKPGIHPREGWALWVIC